MIIIVLKKKDVNDANDNVDYDKNYSLNSLNFALKISKKNSCIFTSFVIQLPFQYCLFFRIKVIASRSGKSYLKGSKETLTTKKNKDKKRGGKKKTHHL